ncbi:MAG: acyl-CoA dehydrogenase, partial [Acidimicrobiales bacterium]
MSIALTDDHKALADTASELLAKRDARGAARALLEAETEERPAFWDEVAGVGWLGLHLSEDHGGSGFGLSELVVVVEEMGRAIAPGPFVPTVIASAVIAAAAPDEAQKRLLPGLADGSVAGAVALGGEVTVSADAASGSAGVVLGGGLADLYLVPVGDDVALVERSADGVSVEVPANLDPARRSARVSFDGAACEVLPGARRALVDLSRLLLSAEAVGVARECTEQAAEYAKVREQFGRPIAMYQAVKHHCANMAVSAELATCLVWDAARAAESGGGEFSLAAAMAATVALPAADECANLNIQVHGGIGFTWEHDAHLYLRRATALYSLLDVEAAAAEVVDLTRAGVKVTREVDLPPEAEPIRDEVQAFVERVKDLGAVAQRDAMIETGYVAPHWPEPWGRAASPVEQLVIEQEFGAAGVKKPAYGITGWVILTLIQHGNDDQVEKWVPPTLRQEWIWCQLFSEPDAGSDAAGVKTKATKVDGGWLVNGQKVWTSGAHQSRWGFATVRTNPDVPKHDGITVMVIDMEAEGVEVRPLRMTSGMSEFNEVFFNDVFVSDEDVVGPVDGGWTVARATLGNESVSIGGGDGGMSF